MCEYDMAELSGELNRLDVTTFEAQELKRVLR